MHPNAPTNLTAQLTVVGTRRVSRGYTCSILLNAQPFLSMLPVRDRNDSVVNAVRMMDDLKHAPVNPARTLIECDPRSDMTADDVLAANPWAEWAQRVRKGYIAFESFADYQRWQGEISDAPAARPCIADCGLTAESGSRYCADCGTDRQLPSHPDHIG